MFCFCFFWLSKSIQYPLSSEYINPKRIYTSRAWYWVYNLSILLSCSISYKWTKHFAITLIYTITKFFVKFFLIFSYFFFKHSLFSELTVLFFFFCWSIRKLKILFQELFLFFFSSALNTIDKYMNMKANNNTGNKSKKFILLFSYKLSS